MTPGRTSQSLSLRPGGSGKWLAWGFNGVLAAMGLVFGVLGFERGRPELVVVGVVLLAPVCLVLLLQPSGELGDDALVLRVGRRHPRTVLLDDIAAVGMVYTIQPRVSAWIPYAWLGDGSAVNLPVGNLMGHEPARVGSDRADLSPDWALLSATSQGESCAAIFDWVAATQGPASLLMTDHQSARHGARGPKERAYWSANRQVGINSLV